MLLCSLPLLKNEKLGAMVGSPLLRDARKFPMPPPLGASTPLRRAPPLRRASGSPPRLSAVIGREEASSLPNPPTSGVPPGCGPDSGPVLPPRLRRTHGVRPVAPHPCSRAPLNRSCYGALGPGRPNPRSMLHCTPLSSSPLYHWAHGYFDHSKSTL